MLSRKLAYSGNPKPFVTLREPVPVPVPRFSSLPPGEDLNFPISNTQHWTKRIHALCTSNGEVDKAVRLLQRLCVLGYTPISLNLSSIVHSFIRHHRFHEAHQFLLTSVSSGHIPDERICNVLIARLLDAKSPALTSRVVYSFLAAKPEYVPSLTNYNRLIHHFCSIAKRPDVAHRLVFDMMDRGHRPSVATLTTLIKGYSEAGFISEAQKVFDEMPDHNLIPNSLSFSTLIRGILMARDLQRGKELMQQLWNTMAQGKDQSLNGASFRNLTDSLCENGYFNEIFELAENKPEGINVDTDFYYSQLIDSLCKTERFHGASRIVYIMKRKGINPSFVSYNQIIHGLCKTEGCMRAYQMTQQGSEFGYSLTIPTYLILTEKLCEVGDVQKARELFNIMLSRNKKDQKTTYNIYLRGLCFIGDSTTEILNVLVNMLESNCEPDVITINTVINGFCKRGKISEACKILDDMFTGKFCLPDVVSCTTIIVALLGAGRAEEAFSIFNNLMPLKGISPSLVTYNGVIKGLMGMGLVKEAKEVFGKMAGADRTTYSIVIGGLGKWGMVDEMKRFWDEVVWLSNDHDQYVYFAMLKGLCDSGAFDEAVHFLYELADCGVVLNAFCYNVVINCAYKMGFKRDAYQILREMTDFGVEPDSVTWRTLDKFHDLY